MEHSYVIAIGVGLVILAIGLIPSYFTISEIVRIHGTRTSYVAELPNEGQAEVFASAQGNKTHSPITHSDCIFWHVLVRAFVHAGRGGRDETIFQSISGDIFSLVDETGQIKVRVDGADAILYDRYNSGSTSSRVTDPDAKRALDLLGFDPETPSGKEKQCQVEERIIPAGKKVYVQGHVSNEGGTKVIASWKGAPIIISDRSERELLGTLYGRVAANIGVILGFAALIVFCGNQFGR